MPNQTEFLVTTQEINWRAKVIESWGDEWGKPDIAYQFSNGRKFDEGEAFYEE